MLEYEEEWLVPGELEYAMEKDRETESKIEKYHQYYFESSDIGRGLKVRFKLTEHILGCYDMDVPSQFIVDYSPGESVNINNSMLTDYYSYRVGEIEYYKIFELPGNDIRRELPCYDDSFLSDETLWKIMECYSGRSAVCHETLFGVSSFSYYKNEFQGIGKACGISDRKLEEIYNEMIGDLREAYFSSKDGVGCRNKRYGEAEGKMADSIIRKSPYLSYHWFFPFSMTAADIRDVVREAYMNAGKRSRRRRPAPDDYINMDLYWKCSSIKPYECMYQGRVGDMTIRFLFDYKNMKISTAYPVCDRHLRRHGDICADGKIYMRYCWDGKEDDQPYPF